MSFKEIVHKKEKSSFADVRTYLHNGMERGYYSILIKGENSQP